MQKSEKAKLMCRIQALGFAVTEASEYLDSHPTCAEALEYFDKHNKEYKQAVKEYEEAFGPITASSAGSDRKWKWVTEPFPWEGEDE